MPKIRFSLFLLLVVFVRPAISQTGKIIGTIDGMADKTLAVVSLLNQKDSSFFKATLCDMAGSFEFELLKNGHYMVEVSYTGYQKYLSGIIEISNEKPVVHLPAISMHIAANGLSEVIVTAKKPFVQRKIDRVVINPDALIGNAGANVLEVLEKAPGVLVDVNGNISLKGKPGVMIFIDDKPTYLAAADLVGYLRSLSASILETVEIMTTPPARYDAAGNAGVINIRLKKNALKGINGGINLSYGQGRYFRTNNSLNLNYRINKFNFFTNISQNITNTYQDLFINRFYYNPDGTNNSGFRQNSYLKRELKGNTARLGADFYASEKNTIGIVLSGFINPSDVPVVNTAKVLDNDDKITALISSNNPARKQWKNGSVNLNYTLKIDNKGKELSANADYIQYNGSHSQNLSNATFTPENVLLGTTILSSSLPSDINIKTCKMDYSNPLKKSWKLDAGFKTSFVHADNTASFFDVVNNVSSPNNEFSNRFSYKENINAAYLNFAKDWKKISLQAGLRMENTNIEGKQFGNPIVKDSGFTRHYTNLFPTFYLQYRMDTMQKHQFVFSFGKRIDRPNYQDMNPFTYPIDRYTYYGGNPFLQPAFSYNFEFSHIFRNFLTTSFEYSIADNLIQETNEQRSNIFYSRPGNFGRQTAYGININGEFKLTKWFNLQLYTEYKNLGYKSIIYGQVLDDNRFYWYVGPTCQFTISKNLSAELAGNYQTSILAAQFLTIPVWSMRAGFSQKILKGKGALKLNISDMFYTNQPGGNIGNIANSKADWLSFLDSRVATISFSYRFSKGKALAARKSGASEEEKTRVKLN